MISNISYKAMILCVTPTQKYLCTPRMNTKPTFPLFGAFVFLIFQLGFEQKGYSLHFYLLKQD